MGDRRISRGAFLGVWAVLVLLQGLAFVGPMAALPIAAKLVWVLLIQVAKIVPTAWRLADTGRDPSDAPFLALVPLVNILGFFQRMMEATPSEGLWARRRSTWEGRLGAFRAIYQGLGLAWTTAPLGLPLVVIYSVLSTLGAQFMMGRMAWAERLPKETLDQLHQGLWAVVGVLVIYTALQVGKRSRVSRASWAPSLLLGPTLLMAIATMFMLQGQGGDLALLVLSMLVMSWGLLWSSFGGAALAVGIILLGDRASRGEHIDAGELLKQLWKRTIDVVGPHGARVHAVTIGMQVVIPGIFYALQLAFSDIIAVLHPDQPALARSGRLTWGMRTRLFKVFFVWVVVAMGLSSAVIFGIQGPDALQASLFDPRALSVTVYLLQELIWGVGAWILTMSLLRMYQDRVARLDASEEPSPEPSPDPSLEGAPADA